MKQTEKVDVECDNCGETIRREVRELRRRERHYCDGECISEDTREGENVECAVCGKEHYRAPSKLKVETYTCSMECRDRYVKSRPAPHHMGRYETWNIGDGSVGVHRLLAVAEGFDPHKVFGDEDYIVHHKSGHKLDNRLGNVDLLTRAEHGEHHSNLNQKEYTKGDMKKAILWMMNPHGLDD